MKRVLMSATLLLLLLSMSECFLIVGDAWSHDIVYIARLTGLGATMDITINDEDGNPRDFANVGTGEWRYNCTVSGLDSFWAGIEADGGDLFTSSIQVEIRVDGVTEQLVSGGPGDYRATAAVLIR